MKCKPILFSTPMVQAILNGTKTQTRRVAKVQPLEGQQFFQATILDGSSRKKWLIGYPGSTVCEMAKNSFDLGDILWVREKFTKWKNHVQYAADTIRGEELGPWKPSIHMPKEACRLFLRVTAVDVEKLQDIGEHDAMLEGVEHGSFELKGETYDGFRDYERNVFDRPSSIDSFETLWKSINGEQSWDENPFVWVYKFERIAMPEGWPNL